MKQPNFIIACLVAAVCQIANAQTIGAWDYEVNEDYYAGTTNDSSNSFGQQCSKADTACRYFIGVPSSCKEAVSYPALVNADSGAFHARLVCAGRGGKYNLYRYVFDDFEGVNEAVLHSSHIGVAVPLEKGEVTVLRFTLDGARAAIAKMRAVADRARGR